MKKYKIPHEVYEELKTQLNGIGIVFVAKEILFDLYPEIMEEQNINYGDIKEVFVSYNPFEEDPFYWEIYVRMQGSNKDKDWGDSLTAEAIIDYIYDVKSLEVFNTIIEADNETLKSVVNLGQEKWEYYDLGNNLPDDYWYDPRYAELLDKDKNKN